MRYYLVLYLFCLFSSYSYASNHASNSSQDVSVVYKKWQRICEETNVEPKAQLHLLPFRLSRLNGISTEDFKSFAVSLVANNMDCFQLRRTGHSPLSQVIKKYGNFYNKIEGEELEKTHVLLDIYSQHEEFFPAEFLEMTICPLYVFLSTITTEFKKYPLFDEVMSAINNTMSSYSQANPDENTHARSTAMYKYAFITNHVLSQHQLPLLTMPSLPVYAGDFEDQMIASMRGKDGAHSTFKECLPREGWRLCMDFDKQRQGQTWVDYEQTEKGTIKSLLGALSWIRNSDAPKIDFSYIYQLHRLCTSHRHEEVTGRRGLAFGVFSGKQTPAFMASFDSLYGEFSRLSYVVSTCFDEETSQNLYNVVSSVCMKEVSNTNAIIDEIMKKYYNDMDEKASLTDKVIVSIEACHSLVMLHPFGDGNTRTFMTCLLNKMLMDLGLDFCAFENPNDFDSKTAQEALPLLFKGWDNYKLILDQKLPEGIKTTEALKRIHGDIPA